MSATGGAVEIQSLHLEDLLSVDSVSPPIFQSSSNIAKWLEETHRAKILPNWKQMQSLCSSFPVARTDSHLRKPIQPSNRSTA